MSIEQNEEAMAAIKKLHELGYSGEQAAAAMVELQKSEPEPLAMYTGEALLERIGSERKDWYVTDSLLSHEFLEYLRDLVLARRVEMLRAMGDDTLVEQVVQAITGLGPLSEFAKAAIALVREHVEASRPALTNEMIESWYSDWALGDQDDDLEYYVAHRAAEYRSNTDALRVKHGTELGALDAEYKKRVAEFNAVTSACAAEVKELRAENERLSARSPQPVDDSDEYGILVQDGCVALVERIEVIENCGCVAKNWVIKVEVSGSSPQRRIDKKCIYKVTSPPRGPLKVPSEEEISGGSRRYTQLSARYFRCGAEFVIDWIKKANGAS